MAYTTAVIGTGPDPEEQDLDGFAMGYQHAEAYEKIDDCELVACADIVRENALAFADVYDLPEENVFEDAAEMLEAVEPDVVSVCVPPSVHEAVVVDCVETEIPAAVHCEKPMADTWDAAQRMAAAAEEHDVRLTFNHQRRFGKPFREAKRLLDAGEIGDLQRVEFATSTVFDYGSHSVDLCNYFNDEGAATWIMGQADYAEENVQFGTPNDTHALVTWEYENGVTGLGTTGDGVRDVVRDHHRLIGSEGTMELDWGGDPPLRIRRAGEGEWERVDCDGESLHGPNFIERALTDVVAAVDESRESELSAKNALKATEIIFGCYESARSRGRVDTPLEVEGSPFLDMIEDGVFD